MSFFFENLSILWETLLLNKTALACCEFRGLSLRGAKTSLPEPFSSNIRTADLITGVWRYGFELSPVDGDGLIPVRWILDN